MAKKPAKPKVTDSPATADSLALLPAPAIDPVVTDYPPAGTDYEPEPKRPRSPRPRSAADAALPWALAGMVVLILAASAGLILAWLVATMHAVPGPIAAGPTPSPSAVNSPITSGGPTPSPTVQPRHTPEPSTGQTPEPFVHVVTRGESLSLIAEEYGVSVDDIIALNNIKNPDKIHEGRTLLIPGYGHEPSASP